MESTGPMTRMIATAVVGAAVALGGGCQRTTISSPLAIDNMPSDPMKDLDFWHSLPGRSAVSNNEGLHGLILFTEGSDKAQNYDERLAFAKEKGWVSPNFNEPGDLAMQRGMLAKAVAVAGEIDGGVMMWVTNKSPRYATRELIYMRIMGEGTEQQVLSGLDYVGVISKMQDYLVAKEAGLSHRNVTKAVKAPDEGTAPAPEGGSPAGESPADPEAPKPAEPAPEAVPAPAPEPAEKPAN